MRRAIYVVLFICLSVACGKQEPYDAHIWAYWQAVYRQANGKSAFVILPSDNAVKIHGNVFHDAEQEASQ